MPTKTPRDDSRHVRKLGIFVINGCLINI
jgi:hypothetical protein